MIRNRDTTHCVFCGRLANSGEHLFSRWTHKYLPPRAKGRAKSVVSIEYADGRTDEDVRTIARAIRDWKVHCVCGGARICAQETRLTPPDQRVQLQLGQP